MIQTILVIDDDPAVRAAFSLILEDAGYQVQEAQNGLQGIELVKQQRPDLIFLDLRMPYIDGVETLRRLKEIDDTLNIYIVTAFANDYMEQLKQALEEGLHFQIASKPLSSSQIRRIASIAETEILPDIVKNHPKLMLTLYVVSLNEQFKTFVEHLNAALASCYQPEDWQVNVIEVLHMPEKALANDVFATPMLVRELPEPIIHILGDLSKMSSVITAITAQHNDNADTILV